MYIIKAFKIGFMDGLESPNDLTIGMTYDKLLSQWAWDHGCNFGQAIGRLIE